LLAALLDGSRPQDVHGDLVSQKQNPSLPLIRSLVIRGVAARRLRMVRSLILATIRLVLRT
jgi:hypothetical protein